MPRVKREIRYKVVKNGKVTHHETKSAARKRAHGVSHAVRHQHHRKRMVV